MNNKLKLKDKIGYGAAAYSDSLTYSITGTFLLFYLTTVAGIQPAAAGVILAVGTVADAIFCPIIGYISDNIRTRFGRRVPFLLFFGVAIFFTLTLLFTAISGPYYFKVIYYGLFVVLFWLSFTGFFIPFMALGAEMTQDYNERTKLRSFSSFTNLMGSLVAMSMPTIMVDFIEKLGGSTQIAWTITAGIIALSASIGIIATGITARRFDPPASETVLPDVNLIQMLREYLGVLKLKPLRHLILTSFLFLIGYEFILSDLIYYLTYCWKMNAVSVSGILMYRCIVGIICVPVISLIAQKTDKKTALITVLIFGTLALCGIEFFCDKSTAMLIALIFAIGIVACIYWQLMPAMVYDLCEYDELTNNIKRQGTIVSAHSFVESISSGIGALLLGFVLQLSGFSSEAETLAAPTLKWIEYCLTYLPGIFMILSCIALCRYPITRKVYEDICSKLSKRN